MMFRSFCFFALSLCLMGLASSAISQTCNFQCQAQKIVAAGGGTMAQQNASSVAITGGTINGTAIGTALGGAATGEFSNIILAPSGTWGSGALSTYSPFFQYSGFSGTPGSTQNAFGLDLTHYDNGSTKGANMSGIREALNVGGSNVTGSRIAVQGIIALNSTTGNGVNASYTAGWFQALTQASEGGTATTPQGGLFGSNPQCIVLSGATYWAQCVGEEIDVGAYTGSSVSQLIGLQVGTAGASNNVNGYTENAAITVNGNDAATYDKGWDCGFCFGSYAGYNSIRATGSLISTWSHAGVLGGSLGDTIANGVDLRGYAFSNYAFASPSFSVDGSGNEKAQSVQLASYTVATLPTCNSTYAGKIAFVTDATAPSYNGALTGGSNVGTLALCRSSGGTYAWAAH